MIGICNSSDNSLFDIFSFLTADLFLVDKVSDRASTTVPPDVFYQNNCKTFNQFNIGVHFIWNF